MEFLIIWALFGVGAAIVANGKGANGCLWFGLGVLLGPFGLLFSFFAGGKQCPECRSKIHKDASRCPKCQADLSATNRERPGRVENPNATWKCPECRATNMNTTFECRACKYRLR